MQLDDTRIVIRERNFFEILDLALQVLRAHGGPLLLTFALGAVPMVLLNTWLLGDWVGSSWDEEWVVGFGMMMTVLVALEMPLAAAPTTLYLGQVMFNAQPSVRRLARDFFRCLPQLVWYQVLLRALAAPLVITWVGPYALWPYLSEVILLERNPMWKGKRGRMTTFRRSRMLHRTSGGDLFGYWLMSAVVGAVLVASCWVATLNLMRMLLSAVPSDEVRYLVCLQLAIWLVAGFFAVVRFLAYLDLRIRREGWEIELSMRAEAARLQGGVS